MRIAYTEERRGHAIKTFERLKSYAKTTNVLGYPSRHTLHDWVDRRPHRKPSGDPRGSPRRHPWALRPEAVQRATRGEGVRDTAKDLPVVGRPSIYEWPRLWRVEGARGLMTRRERISEGAYKTKARLKRALPDGVGQLKDLAARLPVEKAAPGEEPALPKNRRAASRKTASEAQGPDGGQPQRQTSASASA